MILEFKTYQAKKESKTHKRMIEGSNSLNEFIIVGESMLGENCDYFKALQLTEDGVSLIGGCKIDEVAYLIQKKDLELLPGYGMDITELDIPKEYLNMDIIENIQRLNFIG